MWRTSRERREGHSNLMRGIPALSALVLFTEKRSDCLSALSWQTVPSRIKLITFRKLNKCAKKRGKKFFFYRESSKRSWCNKMWEFGIIFLLQSAEIRFSKFIFLTSCARAGVRYFLTRHRIYLKTSDLSIPCCSLVVNEVLGYKSGFSNKRERSLYIYIEDNFC